jgi:hypothetical protein
MGGLGMVMTLACRPTGLQVCRGTPSALEPSRFEMTTPMDQARAFWVAEPGRGEIRLETLRAPLASEALVRTLFTAVSRGTEALVFNGKVPHSEHERMRAPFQAGDFPGPVKYGYSNVGVDVDSLGEPFVDPRDVARVRLQEVRAGERHRDDPAGVAIMRGPPGGRQ